MKSEPRLWPWHLLLAAILVAMAAGLWGATKRMDYTWRWNRVPDYFFYRAEELHKIPFDGNVLEIVESGKTTAVTLRGQEGEQVVLSVATGSVQVRPGEELFEGDLVGSTFRWRLGPLMTGLWVTIWLSFTSGIVGMVLGLVVGLCRVAKNPTLRGLAATYVELIRGTPLLVQIFIFYFFLGTVLNLDRIVAGIGALSIFAGAYVAEIIRAGIQSIP
ncbi:MAG TPA: ABC transporter permease subunit, partial [Deferrisomatales bacterium]|nr:ABC transporter permease subunit [Deferrisomatales bacterium]